MVSPLLNAMKGQIVEEICNKKIATIKQAISDIAADPMKLNDYQSFSSLVYRSTFNKEGLEVNHFELRNLHEAMKIEFKEAFNDCATIYNSPESFFSKVIQDHKDFEGFKCVHEVVTNEAIGNKDITFEMDSNYLLAVYGQCTLPKPADCAHKENMIKNIFSDIVADPFKLNDFQSLALALSKHIDEVNETEKFFNQGAPSHDALQSELGFGINYCATYYNNVEEFLYNAIDSKDVEKINCLLLEAYDDDTMLFNVNNENIADMSMHCSCKTDASVDLMLL